MISTNSASQESEVTSDLDQLVHWGDVREQAPFVGAHRKPPRQSGVPLRGRRLSLTETGLLLSLLRHHRPMLWLTECIRHGAKHRGSGGLLLVGLGLLG